MKNFTFSTILEGWRGRPFRRADGRESGGAVGVGKWKGAVGISRRGETVGNGAVREEQ